MGWIMMAIRALAFIALAICVLSLAAFIGGAIAQPALLSLVPWYHAGGQKI
jgi:hypothetical protein